MDRFSIFQYYHYFFLLLLLLLLLLAVLVSPGLTAAGQENKCRVSRCVEHGPPIRFPFWLKNIQPDHCGYRGFELSCNEKKQTVLELPVSVNMVVKKIDYKSQNIHLRDPDSCLPKHLPRVNLSVSPFIVPIYLTDFALFNCSPTKRGMQYSVPCLSTRGYKVYAVTNRSYDFDLTSCIKIDNITSVPYDIFDSQGNQKNLGLAWKEPSCRECETKGKICSLKNYNATAAAAAAGFELQCLQPKPTKGALKKLLITGSVLGTIFLVMVVIALYRTHTSYKIQKKDQIKVDKFLEDYKAMKPTRYTFADIKKITNRFKVKLGEGGYGTVFKGKLSSEIFVAVKVLNDSIGNGDEFINEVGTMGTIHHVNVVRLVGFCADGTRRALVYEFLPNESLEKFIFSENKKRASLGWDKLQDIALGIAKGVEYLHQGCDHRILHFDIKPHNILLDHNFVPKIADFGLAKLCSKDQSIVSMTAARGTMGYIAPEVFSRNFGNVSYKSDVYSFGMLLLEIVGGRKNIDVTVQNTSQAYFPEWIYNRLISQKEEIEIKIEENDHSLIAKKLTVVGLWCIQMRPTDRPSMKTVVQMLEGKGDAMTMPPNPFASTMENKSSTKPKSAFNRELAVISEVE